MPKRSDINSVLVIGSGPIVIGQACEFDYSGTQACRVLKEEGVRVILCRMRGLETSLWSKLKPKKWKWRRTVTMVFEDHTDEVRTWAQTLDRRAFNEKLESWYNNV